MIALVGRGGGKGKNRLIDSFFDRLVSLFIHFDAHADEIVNQKRDDRKQQKKQQPLHRRAVIFVLVEQEPDDEQKVDG